MLTKLQYLVLRRISPGPPSCMSGDAYAGKSKIRVLLGDRLLEGIKGKTVIDFGCGYGSESLDLARLGAHKVIGIDIRKEVLEQARKSAAMVGLGDICQFATSSEEKGDVIVSIDAFEHFDDPAEVLRTMHDLLTPRGEVLASFGPTWYHPYGGHLFSVFPWAHLIFTEKALIRWRSDFKSDGATRFQEVAGGLNKMTIRRFEKIVDSSPFRLDFLEAVPIRKLARLHNPLTREFTTSVVRCRLVKA